MKILAKEFGSLNEFMNNYRIVGGGYDCTNMSSSVENFTNELMLQKRIEFWGEGIVMFDMKRLDMSTRRGYVEPTLLPRTG